MDSERIFFVTTVAAQRRPIFQRETTAKLLIETLGHYRDERKFLLHEFVVMPDHQWYIIPYGAMGKKLTVHFTPGGKRQKYARYLEAWELLQGEEQPISSCGRKDNVLILS